MIENEEKNVNENEENVSSENETSEITENNEITEKLEEKEPEKFTENGKTYIDITSRYVNNDNLEEKAEDKEPEKKHVRTFNEIFHDFFLSVLPRKSDKTREKIRKIIMDISILTIIGCVIAFANLYHSRLVELKNAKEIKNLIQDDSSDNNTENEYNDGWTELFAQYPNITFPEGMNLKYAYLYAVNSELVGWITIPNTNLDVQVVQTEDNDKYLKKDFYEKTSRYGCPYMDYRNNPQYLDDNTIIYGHHMSDGLMFSNLDKYKDVEGYKESPVFQFDTLYDTYNCKVIGAFVTNSNASDDNNYIFNYTVTSFMSDEKFMSFVDEIKARSFFTTGVQVQADDKLITLSTCSYEFSDARLVVVARLCREGEEPAVDTSLASTNPSPKLPQAWYDAKGLENPYADAEKWTP